MDRHTLRLNVDAPVVVLVHDFQLSAREQFQELLWLCRRKIVGSMLQHFRLVLTKIRAIPVMQNMISIWETTHQIISYIISRHPFVGDCIAFWRHHILYLFFFLSKHWLYFCSCIVVLATLVHLYLKLSIKLDTPKHLILQVSYGALPKVKALNL